MNMNAVTSTAPAAPASLPATGQTVPLYTAGQVAAALGISRRRVYRAMEIVPTSGTVIRDRVPVNAWTFSALPAQYQDDLMERAAKLGFRSADAMLTTDVKPWKPDRPLAEIPAAALAKAARLQRVLVPFLERYRNRLINPKVLEQEALSAYAREMGCAIGQRHFTRLVERTLARDGGSEQWHRVELYLDEHVDRSPAPAAAPVAIDLSDLEGAISQCPDPNVLKPFDRGWIWEKVCQSFDDAVKDGTAPRIARRAIRDCILARVPSLAKSATAFDWTFRSKIKAWKVGGRHQGAIRDMRRLRSGHRRAPDMTDDDRKHLLARALDCGGRLDQAWRELRREKALVPVLLTHYSGAVRRCPRLLSSQLLPDVKTLMKDHHGPRYVRTHGAFIDRDPSDIFSWDWFQADDVTIPVYYYENTPEGLQIMRGQVLAMIDVRSWYILGFALISEKSYNSLHIRRLITTIHDTYGLPNEGFYFENGSWRSRLIVGDDQEQEWRQTECGLKRQLGLKFIHARNPQAKVIERIFGLFQNQLERESIYVGRDEKTDRFERAQKKIQLVRAGKALPAEVGMWSKDEWVTRLNDYCARYNNEPQYGKYLKGFTPLQAFEEFSAPGRKGGRQLPDNCRYLLCHRIMKTKVGRNGISFQHRGEWFTYKSEETGARIGHDVHVFFDLDYPETIGFLDNPLPVAEDERFLITVARGTKVPAMDSDPETIAQAQRENAAHERPHRETYRAITPFFSANFLRGKMRVKTSDPFTAAVGDALNDTLETVKVAIHEEQVKKTEATRLASRLGLANVRFNTDADQQYDALTLREKARKLHERERTQGEVKVP